MSFAFDWFLNVYNHKYIFNVSRHFFKLQFSIHLVIYFYTVIWIKLLLSNTNKWHTVLWFQVFLSNTNNLHTVIWFQVFLSNTNKWRTVLWFQVFLSNPNNLHKVIWFQVFLSNKIICIQLYDFKYSCQIQIICT